jgi:hypothetical protein
MALKSSRVLCNSVLSKGDVKIVKDCKQTVSDCQMASVDGSGDLIKDTGMHKLDCFRYLVEAWFPDFLDKGHKYLRPRVIQQSNLPALERRMADRTMNRNLKQL